MEKPGVFLSYSPQDKAWKDLCLKHLHVLERQELLEVWTEGHISAGAHRHDSLVKVINSVHVAVLIISADFLGSEPVLGVEIPLILERRLTDGLKVMPILVRPCLWEPVLWLAELQMRPCNGTPLSAHRGHRVDAELAGIAEEVLKLARGETLLQVASSRKGQLTPLPLTSHERPRRARAEVPFGSIFTPAAVPKSAPRAHGSPRGPTED